MSGMLSRVGVLIGVLCFALCGMSLAAQDKINVLVVTGGHGFEREAFFSLFVGHEGIAYKEAVQPKANEMIESGEAKSCAIAEPGGAAAILLSEE